MGYVTRHARAIPITEKLLLNVGGWRAMKRARALLEEWRHCRGQKRADAAGDYAGKELTKLPAPPLGHATAPAIRCQNSTDAAVVAFGGEALRKNEQRRWP